MDQYSRTALHLQSFEATGSLEDRVERAWAFYFIFFNVLRVFRKMSYFDTNLFLD